MTVPEGNRIGLHDAQAIQINRRTGRYDLSAADLNNRIKKKSYLPDANGRAHHDLRAGELC